MTLVALLHGGMHWGSSWDHVAAGLEARGIDVVAPDLPVDDAAAGAQDWARVAVSAIDAKAGYSDDVLVVGHSLAGLCVPVVATLRDVRRMVFLAALVPEPGRVFAEHLADNTDAIIFAAGSMTGDGPFGLTLESVRDNFYHDCPETLVSKAFRELRDQAFTVFVEQCPIDRWPDTPSTYILMNDDRAVGGDWARRVAQDRLGADVITMDGGHCPFFARPDKLVATLETIVVAP